MKGSGMLICTGNHQTSPSWFWVRTLPDASLTRPGAWAALQCSGAARRADREFGATFLADTPTVSSTQPFLGIPIKGPYSGTRDRPSWLPLPGGRGSPDSASIYRTRLDAILRPENGTYVETEPSRSLILSTPDQETGSSRKKCHRHGPRDTKSPESAISSPPRS